MRNWRKLFSVVPVVLSLVLGLAVTEAAAAYLKASEVREKERDLDLAGQALVEEMRSVLALEQAALSRMAAFAVLEPPTSQEHFRALAIGHGIPGDSVWYHELASQSSDRRAKPATTYRWPHATDPTLRATGIDSLEETLGDAARSRRITYVGSDERGKTQLAIIQPLQLRDRTGVSAFLISVIDLRATASRASVATSADAPNWTIQLLHRAPIASTRELIRHEYLILDDVTWQITVAPNENRLHRTGAWIQRLTGWTASIALAALVDLFKRRRQSQREVALLRALNREKDSFLLRFAHEIRTPLAGVVGFLDILRNHKDLSGAEREEFLDHAARDAEVISASVHDALVVARHELMIVAEPTNLAEQALAVLNRHNDLAKKVTLDQDNNAWAMADPLRVRQIMRNLLINAIRYGGPDIRITAWVEGDQSVITISDNGPGLPPDAAAILEDNAELSGFNAADQGIGLGLTVAATLAKAMGGNISYRRHQGCSIFRIELPSAANPISSLPPLNDVVTGDPMQPVTDSRS